MASPLYDAISIQHSKNITDPVAAAATNGSRWSTTQRDSHLNDACRRLFRIYFNLATAKEKANRDASNEWRFLEPYLAEEAQSLTANTKTLASWTGTASFIISAYNATDSLPVKLLLPNSLRFQVETGGIGQIAASTTNQYYILDGASFRLLDGTANSSDSIKLRYVKAFVALSAGGATDILISSVYWDQVLDMAQVVAFEEYPTAENSQKVTALLTNLTNQLYGTPTQ